MGAQCSVRRRQGELTGQRTKAMALANVSLSSSKLLLHGDVGAIP